MKSLNQFVNEQKTFQAFRINQNNKPDQYTCHPKDKKELIEILKDRLQKDKNADLNDIDVSNIKSMSYLFKDLDPHNIDISLWNVSNVENMQCAFNGCENFNCDLSKWDVSNVKDMYSMFFNCKSFEGKGLEKWDVENVTHVDIMFYECHLLFKLNNVPRWYKQKMKYYS